MSAIAANRVPQQTDDPDNVVLTKTAVFPAPREVVWAYLTQADKLARWFHRADADLAQGRDYALLATGNDGKAEPLCWGNVIEADPPRRLVTTFTVKPLAGRMTTVTYQLDEVAGGTRLTLTHEGLPSGEAFGLLSALDAGWDGHIADLRTAVAE